jgi:hypothetical protein
MEKYELRMLVRKNLNKKELKKLQEGLWRAVRDALGKSAKGIIVISSPKI